MRSSVLPSFARSVPIRNCAVLAFGRWDRIGLVTDRTPYNQTTTINGLTTFAIQPSTGRVWSEGASAFGDPIRIHH